ncbi:MAG: type II toxin-antitoxin system Phd/YefM family antitoxin [Acidimicrobiales bacterium]
MGTPTERVTAEELRTHLGDVLGRVTFGESRVVVTRHGRPVAMILPMTVHGRRVAEVHLSPCPVSDRDGAARPARGRWAHLTPGRSLADELIAERRAEGSLEDAEALGDEATMARARKDLPLRASNQGSRR